MGIFLNPHTLKIDPKIPTKFFFNYKYASLVMFNWISRPCLEIFKDFVVSYSLESSLPYNLGKSHLVYDYSEYSSEELANEF